MSDTQYYKSVTVSVGECWNVLVALEDRRAYLKVSLERLISVEWLEHAARVEADLAEIEAVIQRLGGKL